MTETEIRKTQKLNNTRQEIKWAITSVLSVKNWKDII